MFSSYVWCDSIDTCDAVSLTPSGLDDRPCAGMRRLCLASLDQVIGLLKVLGELARGRPGSLLGRYGGMPGAGSPHARQTALLGSIKPYRKPSKSKRLGR